ncbi:polysaccharide biosynthesis tyrosine autokinase [Myceligenerans indicum]|uniref:non-specific protein-tyrosine kinase n=1 Tax=Myceligenerans indicum TaxID=2593663 RepID=A0ABS1LMS7_9MICO|nr:polysaccharide biosynthesis tyrosine autokinase [Myceligenerans indicum]MBL0887534.1 polysaccharide biosynthesis tyrosine autokinase [Myceligenerans indicum]
MGLAEYLGVLRKYWMTIAATVVVVVVLAVMVTVLAAPRYQASSQVFVSVRGGDDSVSALVAGRAFSAEQVTSYTELVTSPRVLEPVIDELGLADTPASLASRVSADRPKGTVLIDISVEDESPTVAAGVANGVADSLATVVAELETEEGSSTSPVEVSTIRDATVPGVPASPRPVLNIALGLLAGLVLGVGIAVLRDVLDTRVRTPDDVETIAGASVIGVIPFDAETPRKPLIVSDSPLNGRAEAFRRLRTNLQFLEVGTGSRCFVVVSALPGEGKSTTSINLAITLADAGSRVAVVDGDLRRPSISRYLGMEGSVGLTTVLIGKVDLAEAMQPWGNENLHVLPSGQIPPNPSELLGSVQMVRTIERLTKEYDVVLIDSAPLLPVTDGAILAKMTGGAILVVGAGVAHTTQVQEAARALATVDADLVGTVLNRSELTERSRYQYQYYASDESDSPAVTSHREASSALLARGIAGLGRHATGLVRRAGHLGDRTVGLGHRIPGMGSRAPERHSADRAASRAVGREAARRRERGGGERAAQATVLGAGASATVGAVGAVGAVATVATAAAVTDPTADRPASATEVVREAGGPHDETMPGEYAAPWSGEGRMVHADGADRGGAEVGGAGSGEAVRDHAGPGDPGRDHAGPDRVSLDRVGLDYVGLDQADPDDADLDQADLDEADLDEADLDEADLDEADLDEADLDEADLDEADLDGIVLEDAAPEGTALDDRPADSAGGTVGPVPWPPVASPN